MRRLALIAALLILLAAPQARAADPQPWDACSTANQVQITGGAENSGTRDFLICNVASFPTWTAETAAGTGEWFGPVYGNGLFVAVAQGPTYAMTSPDGINWTAQTPPNGCWQGLAYGNGIFVVLADGGPCWTYGAMTSPDGITWTGRTSAAPNNSWVSVAYGNGLFVAVDVNTSDTNQVMTSPDGITWTLRTAAEANPWQSVTYGNGLFVAVAWSGTHRVMTSPDGITWTAQTAAQASSWWSVTYGNGKFVAVSQAGANRVMTSPDGITWTLQTAAALLAWNVVTYGNGLFVAVANNAVMTSPDGITWTSETAAEANSWEGVTYGNGLFAAVSYSGTHQVMIKSNGGGWQSTARLASGGNVGIGNTSPGALLDIGKNAVTPGTMRLEGSSSGYLQLQAAAGGTSWTATLPGSAGTSGYLLSTNGSGALSWVAAGTGVASNAISGLSAATASSSINSTNRRETMTWNTLTTGTALTLASSSLTTGNLLFISDSSVSTSNSHALEVLTADSGDGAVGIYSEMTASSGSIAAIKGVSDGGSPNGVALRGVIIGGSNSPALEGDSDGAIGVKGYNSNTLNTGDLGVYGQTSSTGTGSMAVYGTSTAATGVNYGVYGTNAGAGPAGYFFNTAGGVALATGAGKVQLGSGGTAFSNMGICMVASYTPTFTATNVTCTGVPASTAVAVSCSASGAFSTTTGNAIHARATGTINQIAVNLPVANTNAVTLTCMWVQP